MKTSACLPIYCCSNAGDVLATQSPKLERVSDVCDFLITRKTHPKDFDPNKLCQRCTLLFILVVVMHSFIFHILSLYLLSPTDEDWTTIISKVYFKTIILSSCLIFLTIVIISFPSLLTRCCQAMKTDDFLEIFQTTFSPLACNTWLGTAQ